MQTLAAQSLRSTYLEALTSTIPGKIVAGLAATAVVALAAHVTVPLPFTPIPLTLQPLAVLAVGLALGPVAGLLSMLAYLCEGAVGLPVFAPTGPGGVAQILGPTGGFLMAYPVVAFIAGGVSRMRKLRMPANAFVAAAGAASLATLWLFACGAGWLMHLLHLSAQRTWQLGVAPFLPGALIHVLLAAGLYRTFDGAKRIE